MFKRHEVSITTNSSGAATVYSPILNGRIYSIQYIKDDFADGSTFTITLCNQDNTAGSAESLWSESNVNASTQRAPRQPTHANDGSASLYASSGEPVEDYYVACHERVKIVIANGGNAKSGKFYIKVG
jgi:hypothetical protein